MSTIADHPRITAPLDADADADADAQIDSICETLWARGLDETITPDATLTLHGRPDDIIDTREASVSVRPGRSLGPAQVNLGSLPPITLARDSQPGLETELPDTDLRVVGLLGEGGMGRVELARQTSLRREVALKTVSRRAGQGASRALVREALFTGFLEHPNIVPVHQLGRLDESPVLVMKRVDGVSWAQLIEEPDHAHWGHLTRDADDPDDRLAAHLGIAMQVCHAVEFAHSRDIVHRDIKPENVMVGAFGEVYLMDWGVALDLQGDEVADTSVVGTPSFMAPEMLDGARGVGPHTDVFLLGATLYTALSGGQALHRGEGIRATLLSAWRCEPPVLPEAVPEELAALVRRCVAREPASRPGSAQALRGSLADFLRHRGSLRLTVRAEQRLQRAQCETTDAVTDRGLLSEARFGFEQALQIWEGNTQARRGLQRCLESLIALELEERNRGLAASLYEALPEPVPALAERIEALGHELARDERSREELERLRHDFDPRVAARQRAIFTFVIGALVGVWTIIAAVVSYSGLHPVSTAGGLVFSTMFMFIIGAGLFLHRRSLMQTRVNRQLSLTFLTMSASTALSRLCLYLLGAPLLYANVGDLVLCAAFVAMAAIIDSRLKWLVPMALAGPLLAVAFPDYALVIEGAVLFGTATDIAWMWRSDSACALPGTGSCDEQAQRA